MRRFSRRAACIVLSVMAAVGLTAEAQEPKYDYNKGSSSPSQGGGGDGGFVLLLEGALFNPRNTDLVVATEIAGSSVFPIVPNWDEDAAGRIGVGYEWPNGTTILGSYWMYEGDQSARGGTSHGGFLAFALGPPIAVGADYIGDEGAPGYFQTMTEISAETADLSLGHRFGVSEAFTMEWSLGLRYARYEEVRAARYDEAGSPLGVNRFDARKDIEGKMIGARVAARGSYRMGAFSLGAELGVSLLDGELNAVSSLAASGSGNQGPSPARAGVGDDGRSGSIRDFEADIAWHLGRTAQLSLGWEQAEWRDIAADPLRNFPGTIAPLNERDAVVFSGLKLGLRLVF